MLTIEPPTAERIGLITACRPLNTPTRLISKTIRKCARGSCSRNCPVDTPALLTRPLSEPNSSRVNWTAADHCSGSVTSRWVYRACGPSSPTRCLPSSSSRSASTTLPPRARICRANAAPSPLAPPLISTTFPANWPELFCIAIAFCRVSGTDESKHHRGPDRRTGTRVVVTHHCGRAVTGGVEPGDDATVGPQHLAVGVVDQTAFGAQVAGLDARRVVRRAVDDVHRRVRQRRVAVVVVVGAVAPTEIAVVAGARESIEYVDGFAQRRRRHADRRGQRVKCVRTMHQPRREPVVGELLAWHHAAELIAVLGFPVEDEPDRIMPTGELLVHERDIRRGLVDEAPAGLVDDDRAGNRPLGDQHAHHAVGPLERRHPPGVVHQIDGTAAGPARHDPVAGGVGRACAGVVLAAVPKEMLSHLTVVLKTPGSQQDPFARPDADYGAVPLGSYADNGTGVVGD